MTNRTTSVSADETSVVSKNDNKRLLLAALLEQSEEPLVLFDASGMVMAANKAMTNLHAAPAGLVGKHLERVFSFKGKLSVDALIANLTKSSVAVGCSPNGEQKTQFPWRIEFDVFREGEGEPLVLGKVTFGTAGDSKPSPPKRVDVDFAITLNPKYQVVEFTAGKTGSGIGSACHQTFFNNVSPCEGCPLQKPGMQTGQATSSSIWDDTAGAFRLVTAVPLQDRTNVQERWISEEETAVLIASRIDRLAARARATRRERVVLELLILGRSLEEIATAIGITVHTVKFHQANLLKKMGADSRVDLLRLLLL